MENSVETKSKRFAFSFTVGIHLLLFLFLLFTGFIEPEKTILPEYTSSGEAGLAGYKLIELDEAPVKMSAAASPKLVSDPQETEAIVKQGTEILKTTIEAEGSDSEFQSVLERLKQLKKSAGQNKNSNGISETNGKGEDKKGNSLETVTDDSYFLEDRSLIEKPEAILNDMDEGKVVVDIVVNEEGKVVRAIPGQRGSTTTSAILYAKAMKAALTAKFNPSKEGIKEQRGTYTFVFTLE